MSKRREPKIKGSIELVADWDKNQWPSVIELIFLSLVSYLLLSVWTRFFNRITTAGNRTHVITDHDHQCTTDQARSRGCKQRTDKTMDPSNWHLPHRLAPKKKTNESMYPFPK